MKSVSKSMDLERAKLLLRWMATARAIDERERVLVSQNLADFQVSGAGHEAAAAVVLSLVPEDYVASHYRDKALLIARGVAPEAFFRQVLARSTCASSGRQLPGIFSAPTQRVLSMGTPVGNHVMHGVGIAAAVKHQQAGPIVVCSVGDGTSQEGEFLEAIAEAVRWQLPVLFLIQNNRYSISTATVGKTFFDLPSGPAEQFYGLPIKRIDGSDPVRASEQFEPIVSTVRDRRTPQLVVLNVERLTNHSNADDQSLYRAAEELAHGRSHCDPLAKLRLYLTEHGASGSELDELDSAVQRDLEQALRQTMREPEPHPVFNAKAPLPQEIATRTEYRGGPSFPRLTMREAVCGVLRHRLATDSRVFLYGQDIEDPKGDVFGITRGLSASFPGRVVNAPLSESTIVGTAIGRALAGQRPVAFIQFADFLPVAFNQILSELGSMYWRSSGVCQCPVIVMAPCGGYRPGMGPFHAQTMEAFTAHVPGIEVVMPSSAADAAGLLNLAFESPRPTVFLYPKSCLNLSDRATSDDVAKHWALPGKARRLSAGKDLTLVSWGSAVIQCERAVSALSENGFRVDFLDLRSLSPWDEAAVLASSEKTGKLIVVHEDNRTAGFGAEVVATVAERIRRPAQMRRITRPDTYVPYHYGNQLEVLPSFKRILEGCADLLNCDVSWDQPPQDRPGEVTLRAMGTGPADESVEILKIHVSIGDIVSLGQVIAEVETMKSVVEIVSTASGRVIEISAAAGQRIPVGCPLMRLQVDDSQRLPISITLESPGIPRIIARSSTS
jgi:2-oxoisovalerate dehydrogenase E1 component